MVSIVGFFSLLYLWFTLFPGRVDPEIAYYFNAEQIEQGRRYHMVLRLLSICGFLVPVLFLTWLLFSGRVKILTNWVQQLTRRSFWGSLLLFFVVVWFLLQLLQLPFQLYGGHFWQKQWGISTQSLGGWWLDYLQNAGFALFFSVLGVILLFWAINRWPRVWWLLGAGTVSFFLLIQTFFWPLLIAPRFNHFTPVTEPQVLEMVQELSLKAEVPVSEVWLMDASRRTTNANAYFTGLGETKRIVLYDTLLTNYSEDEVKAVLAHEMAHWKHGHITKGLFLGVLGNFLLWGLLFLLLRTSMGSCTRYPPYTLAMIWLFFLLASFVTTPVSNHFSRSMEVEADQTAVVLTQDALAAQQLQVHLATQNLSDVAPAPFIQWFSYSHPAALERIKTFQQAGTGG